MPIYADIDSALKAIVNDIDWGNLMAWALSQDTAMDKRYRAIAKMMKGYDQSGTVFGDVLMSQTECVSANGTSCHDRTKMAPVKLMNKILDDDTQVTMFSWRSKFDGNRHRVLVVDETQFLLDLFNSGLIFVPSPEDN
jgi:hypothetical protein